MSMQRLTQLPERVDALADELNNTQTLQEELTSRLLALAGQVEALQERVAAIERARSP